MSSIFRNGKSLFERIALDNAAAANDEPVRLGELNVALSGVAPVGHGHTVASISDFESASKSLVQGFLVDGDTIVWSAGTVEGTRKSEVKLKTGGGLKATADGLEADIGTGATQVAAGDHTHTLLHAPLAVASGSKTISHSLAGQTLGLEVKRSGTGGLKSADDGLSCDWGTGANQVPRGNHTHTDLQAKLTAQHTSTLNLYLAGGTLSGVVPLDESPDAGRGKLVSTANGLAVVLGEAADEAAAGNHSHALATETQSGFLSAEDKRSLNLYTALLQVDASIGFHRHDVCPQGEYVGGRHRWGQSMQLVEFHVTVGSGPGDFTLALESDDVEIAEIPVPSGTTFLLLDSLEPVMQDLHVPASTFLRVKMKTAPSDLFQCPSRIDIGLTVRPSLASAPTLRVDCGQTTTEVEPFAVDSGFSGGQVTDDDGSVFDLTGVTDPAPEAVYRTTRYQYGSVTPLTYTLTGLARGVSYKVRLHFAELTWTEAGQQLMKLDVIGLTTATTASLDVFQAAGARFKAHIVEHALFADSNGQIQVKITPLNAGGSFNLAINGIEAIPQG